MVGACGWVMLWICLWIIRSIVVGVSPLGGKEVGDEGTRMLASKLVVYSYSVFVCSPAPGRVVCV